MFTKSNDSLKPVTVYLEFDTRLQLLTGTAREQILVSEGTPFIMFLQAILETYPGIMKTYSFTALGFDVNGVVPGLRSTLTANDVVKVHVSTSKDDFSEVNPFEYRH